MELWLLAAGAILLVAITAWIVWPAEPEERISMRSNPETPDPQDIPPQGDRFEDQYTSATGDLSAGGVAEAFAQSESAEAEVSSSAPDRAGAGAGAPASTGSAASTAPSGESWPRPTLAREGTGDRFQTPIVTSHTYPGAPLAERSLPSLPVPAAAVLTVGGAVAGAWLYARWQERNRPVNRLRRRARDVASHLPDVASRLPDMDDLPSGAAPRGGAAAAVLLTSLALARALRGGSGEDELESDRAEREAQQQRAQRSLDRLPWRELVGSVDWASLLREAPSAVDVRGLPDRGKRLLEDSPSTDAARKRARRLMQDLPDADELRKRGKRVARQLPSVDDLQEESARPALFGLGFGGLAAVAGACYLVWRVLRGT